MGSEDILTERSVRVRCSKLSANRTLWNMSTLIHGDWREDTHTK